jgi:hypothetical protein
MNTRVMIRRIDRIYECTENGTFAPRFANELAADTNFNTQRKFRMHKPECTSCFRGDIEI